ncbi:MAG: glucose-6-phosphate isomerase [Clostridium sp.]
MLNIDYSRSKLRQQTLEQYKEAIIVEDKKLEKMIKQDKSMTGWVFYPENYNKEEYNQILKVSKKIKKNSDVLLVIGIGGSYLGTKAIIEAIKGPIKKKIDNGIEVIFVGQNMSTQYINQVIEYIMDKDFSINVISKSGTTTEPAIAFRIFKEILYQKYSLTEAIERIFVTTDKENGALKQLAIEEEYTTFCIPSNIGGRYSVFTPVGILPLEVAGIDTKKLLKGAKRGVEKYLDEDILKNPAYQYATLRHLLYNNYGKDIEIFAVYEESFRYIIEWLKQLFNESEGKDFKGIYSTGAIFTTDLHSIGQYIQQGRRNIFETVINVKDMQEQDIILKEEEGNLDELNYLNGKSLEYINKTAMEATMNAHLEGDVPCILIEIKKLDEENLGELLYFFQKACAIYCMLQKIDPFNQPGVEAYKTNMFYMLNKPGYTI